MNFEIILRGGRVVDASQQLDAEMDVVVHQGRIVRVGPTVPNEQAELEIDVRGLIVAPGLIDLHVHVYPHSPWGLDPDSLCAANGVTTMVDAGTAGSYSFAEFRRETIDRARTRVLALVHLSSVGLLTGSLGELLDRRYADVAGAVQTLRDNPGVAVGVKIRASRDQIGEGRAAWDNLQDAVRAAREANVWLMVHIGDCPMSIPELLNQLSPGDCVTHCYRQSATSLLNDQGRVWEEVREARRRGVVFDVGHGYGSFSWDVAEAAINDGFEPDTISTDLHRLCIHGPAYDLPTTMSKFLALGAPLPRVIEMTTRSPARILGLEDQLGALRPGAVADIVVLHEEEGRFRLTDCHGQDRIADRLLRAALTIRGGEIVPGGGSFLARRR